MSEQHWLVQSIDRSNLWILMMDGKTGHITLNPAVPQDEAVHQFIKLCNQHINSELRQITEKYEEVQYECGRLRKALQAERETK